MFLTCFKVGKRRKPKRKKVEEEAEKLKKKNCLWTT